LYALNLKTGNIIYSSVNGGANTMGNLTSRNGKIFAMYNTILIAIDSKTGTEVWRKDPQNGLGFSATPVEDAGTVYAATTSGIPI